MRIASRGAAVTEVIGAPSRANKADPPRRSDGPGRSRISARRFEVEAGPLGSSRPVWKLATTRYFEKPAGIVTASSTLTLREAAYEEPIQGRQGDGDTDADEVRRVPQGRTRP